eukprot:Amastigsp_a508909_11.p4 type:complete len:114 gc:universal Amastigsp_a508909_11:911-570(-)
MCTGGCSGAGERVCSGTVAAPDIRATSVSSDFAAADAAASRACRSVSVSTVTAASTRSVLLDACTAVVAPRAFFAVRAAVTVDAAATASTTSGWPAGCIGGSMADLGARASGL